MASIVNLKEYLRRVFNDLKDYTDGLSTEALEEFHEKCRKLFRNGEGDYTDRHLLAYYVMEYARAYGFEFSRAYTDILARIRKCKKEVSSVSFGCGTGIDYWGMSHAARVMLRDDEVSLSYTGIDPVDWAYKVSDSPDMPEEDQVDINSVHGHAGGDECRCSDFGEYLSLMESDRSRKIPDIYFFPHSLKEVCLHTVPDGGAEQYRYNAYQSMARFSGLIGSRLEKGETLYIAVTYRKKPQGLEHYHAYDTRYATYLVDCLARRGLKVSQLKPGHITRPGYQDMEIINDTEENIKYYFRYEQNHFYTGKKCADGEKLELWQMGNDEFGSFDKLFDGKDNAPAITDVQTWIDVVGRNLHSMDSVGNMCYQVFKIRANESDDADIQNAYLYGNECVDMVEKALRTFEFPIEKDRLSLRAMVYNLPRHIESQDMHEQITDKVIINMESIANGLIDDGLLQADIDDDGVTYNETVLGKRMGVYVYKDRNGRNAVGLDSFAQQSVVANLVSGGYLKAVSGRNERRS